MKSGAWARSKFWVLGVLLTGASLMVSASDTARAPAKREDLIGAWRLVRIEVSGPHVSSVDPFYGTGTEGLLIYDSAGWFSVQIMGSDRPRVDVPSRRPEAADDSRRDLKAAALDSYYAYYGTWTYDASTSTVTHHAKGALYPSEHDAIYPQHVEFQGANMIFTRAQTVNGERSTQSKIWIRAADHW